MIKMIPTTKSKCFVCGGKGFTKHLTYEEIEHLPSGNLSLSELIRKYGKKVPCPICVKSN